MTDDGQISQLLQPAKKSIFSLKGRSAFRAGAKIYLSQKDILGLGKNRAFRERNMMQNDR